MQEVSEEILTKFLIHCMTAIFETRIPKVAKPVIPAQNIRQYIVKDDEVGLMYLETCAGNIFQSHSDIRVFTNDDGALDQVWGMHVISRISRGELVKANLAPTDILRFLINARLRGFGLTRKRIARGEKYSLLDVEQYKEPAPVGKNGTPGDLAYNENIDDDITFFCGDEVVRFEPEQCPCEKSVIFTAYYQGGRI